MSVGSALFAMAAMLGSACPPMTTRRLGFAPSYTGKSGCKRGGADPDKKRRRKARQKAQRRNR